MCQGVSNRRSPRSSMICLPLRMVQASASSRDEKTSARMNVCSNSGSVSWLDDDACRAPAAAVFLRGGVDRAALIGNTFAARLVALGGVAGLAE